LASLSDSPSLAVSPSAVPSVCFGEIKNKGLDYCQSPRLIPRLM
jgi:hypothetical protein